MLAPLGQREVRLALGEYGNANGESLPIQLRLGTGLKGTSNQALACLSGFGHLISVPWEDLPYPPVFENIAFRGLGSPTGVALRYVNSVGLTVYGHFEVRGCTFENFDEGIHASGARVVDSVFTQVNTAVNLNAFPVLLDVDACTFQDCTRGIEFRSDAGLSQISVKDCRFVGGTFGMFSFLSYTSDANVEVSRSRFEGLECALYSQVLFAPNGNSIDTVISNSIFTGNAAVMETGVIILSLIHISEPTRPY